MECSIISIENYDPISVFGVNDVYLNKMRELFPKIRIIARGEMIKVEGAKKDRLEFEKYIDILLCTLDVKGKLSAYDIESCQENEQQGDLLAKDKNSDFILYGKYGNAITARTPNQKAMVKSIAKHDLIFAIGPAGSGKTFTAVALAVRALKNKQIRRIILTRPAVEAGESLGFLPGDVKDKLDPFLRPLYDALNEMIPSQKLKGYIEDGTIEIAPLAFMRGRTLNHAFAILDEAQNATDKQLKMFLTRMGEDSKFIITGDITQIDLPKQHVSGLLNAQSILGNVKGIDFINLNEKDIIRHKLVTDIVKAYEKINK
ncbi:MAG: PhoH family protein [Bacteroidales bacterium]|jgi:phosphate starvation-inducible PhoH-like protein